MDLDGLRRQAENLLDEHGAEVSKAIDKAEELAKGRISGHDGQIDQVADRLRDYVDDHDKSGKDAPPAAKTAGGKARPAAKAPGKQGGRQAGPRQAAPKRAPAKQGGRPAARQPRRPD